MQKLIALLCVIATVWWFTGSNDTEALVLADGSLEYPGYTFSNAEPFTLEARVLSRENYRLGRETDLSPTDLALGWGRMSEDAVIDEFEISQSGRWYYWRADRLPIPRAEINSQSANVHIVPATAEVARVLADIETLDHVRLTGKLVDIRGEDGWRWTSSRSRTDTGNGSCELLLLERIDHI